MIFLALLVATLALAVASVALALALAARRDARDALARARAVSGQRRRPFPVVEVREERREEDLGPPVGEPERRHRAPDPGVRYDRLRASADAREAAEDVTVVQRAVRADENLPTSEHPAPGATRARPLPPLPRPGTIGRPR